MKIMFLIGNMNLSGGTERVCSIIANKLSNAGYDVYLTSIACGEAPFFLINDDITQISITKTVGRSLYRMPLIVYKLRKAIIENKIDIVISVESMSVLFSLPAIVGLSIKHICWEHFNFKSDLGRKGRRLARQLAARYCNAIVTLTERDKKYWIAGTKHNNQITAIANPCPFKIQNNSYNNNSKIVLAVGRLVEQKGFDYLCKAWHKIAKRAPGWKLIIVGEGGERGSLTELLVDKKLTDSVELVGNTDNVQKYYEEAAIFCLSSRFEGFPMVLLETLSFGLPVVSFDCDTGPEEVLNGTGALLVKPESTDALAESLVELINNEQLRKDISLKSKEKASQYQVGEVIKRWERLFVSL